MDGQPVLADIDAVDEAGRHHPPADRALQAAEQPAGRRASASGRARRGRVAQKNSSGSANTKPTPRARMRCAHSHQKIRLKPSRLMPSLIWAYSGNLLVLGEFLLPFGIVERRDDAVDRLPFGDRQAGIGQPRRAADEHQRHQHDEHDVEPAAQQRPVGQLPVALAAHRSAHPSRSNSSWRSDGAIGEPSRAVFQEPDKGCDVARHAVTGSRDCAAAAKALSGGMKRTEPCPFA